MLDELLEIIEKEPAKVMSKIEKYVYHIFMENIFSAYNPMEVVDFCKHVLIM